MSVKIMARVWENEAIYDHTELLILLAMADFADDEGNCFPSMKRLAKKSRISDRQAHRVVKNLCEKKWLGLVELGGVRNGKNVSNRYRILIAGGGDAMTPPTRGDTMSPGGDAVTPRGDAIMSPGGVTPRCQTARHFEPSKETTTYTRAKAMPKTPEDVVVPLVERPLEAELGQLANEFDLTQPQAATLAKCVQCEGIQYVREQAEIVRSKPNVRNLAGALLNALEKGWRKPKTAPKSLRRKAAEPEGWREWIKEKYPNADIPGSWKELFPSVQNEFLARKSVAAGIPAKSESA